MTALSAPWKDRAGQVSILKLAVFCSTLLPALWLLLQALMDELGTKPITEAIHQSGDWAIRLLLISLAVTPLRFVAQWPKLIQVRRMLGLAALAYGILHLALYTVQQDYSITKITSEILFRTYLTIGFAALLGLIALGVTSTDGMIRRLGSANWNRLHSIVYGMAVLAVVHYFLQTKLDVTQAVLMAGAFFWLMGFRGLRKLGVPVSALMLVLLAFASALLTALSEAAWYASMTGVMASRIFFANLDFETSIRPAWWILSAGFVVILVYLIRKPSASTRVNAKNSGKAEKLHSDTTVSATA